MDLFVLGSVAVLALMAGYWAGRSIQWQMADGMADAGDESAASLLDKRENSAGQRRILLGQVIGSPASGVVSDLSGEGKASVRIRSGQGRIYAPASGRITRLYPMGRAMELRTEFGAELLIEVGENADEMQSGRYRCRVMEHEVVRKGKLLLEYDVAGLQADGVGADVTMSVENREQGSVSVSADACVRAGEEVMRVRGNGAVKWEG